MSLKSSFKIYEDKIMYNEKKLMTKKALKEKNKRKRVTNNINTGTRDMKSNKYPTRAKQKRKMRELINSLDF
jgi:hypothetical protein